MRPCSSDPTAGWLWQRMRGTMTGTSSPTDFPDLKVSGAPKPRRSGTDDDRFTAGRIHALLRDVVDGANAVDICLAENIPPATFHHWQKSYFGMTVEQIERHRRKQKRRFGRFVGTAAATIAGAGAVY